MITGCPNQHLFSEFPKTACNHDLVVQYVMSAKETHKDKSLTREMVELSLKVVGVVAVAMVGLAALNIGGEWLTSKGVLPIAI